jgi:hypothetical protein
LDREAIIGHEEDVRLASGIWAFTMAKPMTGDVEVLNVYYSLKGSSLTTFRALQREQGSAT